MDLPKDPFMLLSVINTKLRDNYSSLDNLCDDLQQDKTHLISVLESIGYTYDESSNRFVQRIITFRILKRGAFSMDKLERRGHRQRMRDAYLRGGADSMADHNMLELFLSLVIPQKDVKPLAYDLINTFGSLERVVSASPQRLMEVKKYAAV